MSDKGRRIYKTHKPYWTSTLFSEVFLKNDLPRKYSKIWDRDDGFEDFQQRFHNFVLNLETEDFENWTESDTIHKWIIKVMKMLGWHDECENDDVMPLLTEQSFTVPELDQNMRQVRKTYRTDLVYVDKPEYSKYITRENKNSEQKLREAKNPKTGVKVIVEAKFWDRLELSTTPKELQVKLHTKNGKKRDDKPDRSVRHLDANDQILKYMDILEREFGILTDGKVWRLFHIRLSKGDSTRYFEFDLGKLAQLLMDGVDSKVKREEYLDQARYFYCIFRKKSLVQKKGNLPLVQQLISDSEKYSSRLVDDLKVQFMESMSLMCNAYKTSAEKLSLNCDDPKDLRLLRKTCESHLFNILFIRACEANRILPARPPAYLKKSLEEIVETLYESGFDPGKEEKIFLDDFRETFGPEFELSGTDIYDRLLNLCSIIDKGTMGFRVHGFRKTIFSDQEWGFVRTYKIPNNVMIRVLFSLNFVKADPSLKNDYQQIPFNYFTPRQIGSIYESFLEYELAFAKTDLLFWKGKWRRCNLKSEKVKSLKSKSALKIKKGQLYFADSNADRKSTGSYFTDDFLVEYVTKKTLAPLLNKGSSAEILRLSVCDPAMGSGHFINSALHHLTRAYRAAYENEELDDISEGYKESLRKVLDSSINGFDVNASACKLAKLSLWLAVAEKGKEISSLDRRLIHSDSIIPKSKHFKSGFSVTPEFSVVLSNPPWDKLKFEELDFFKKVEPGLLSKTIHKAEKRKIFDSLLNNSFVEEAYTSDKDITESKLAAVAENYYKHQNNISKKSRSRHIDHNLYKLAAERYTKMAKLRFGLVLPTGILGDLGCSGIRDYFFKKCSIESVLGFRKDAKVFPIAQPFCTLVGGKGATGEFCYIDNLNIEKFHEISKNELPTNNSSNLVRKLDGDTLTISFVPTKLDAAILEKLVDGTRKFGLAELSFGRELHQTDDANSLQTRKTEVSVFKGGDIDHFTIRNASQYLKSTCIEHYKRKIRSDDRIAIRAISGTTDPRRLVATPMFEEALTVNSLLVSKCELSRKQVFFYAALLNSRVVEYRFRQISKNNNVNKYALGLLPIVRYDEKNKEHRKISSAARELFDSYSSKNVESLDLLISNLFKLTKFEYALVKGAIASAERVEKSPKISAA